MIRWLITAALRQPVFILALAMLLFFGGIHVSQKMPLDVFPEFAPPLVEIQTEAAGLSTEEVESLITVPLESALNGIAWLKTLRSKSVLGLSSVVCIFQDGTDLMRARQLVQERLATARLPVIAKPPVILQPLSSTSRAMKIGVTSEKLSQMQLSELALWTIRPKLMAIQGVANVAIWGQRDRQLQVLVNPERLAAQDITLDMITSAAGDAVTITAGGFVDLPNQRLPVRQTSSVTTPEELAQSVVTLRGGVPVRLADVAEVVEASPPAIGDAVINNGEGLLLIVEKQPWGNTLTVTQQVETALHALRPALPDVKVDATIFRPATFIERALSNLSHTLLLSCALVALILVAFLFEWRTAVISLSAIPLSLLAAVLVLYWRGDTLNTMVLAGLVIAVGEVVDDAIIDVENITRRLRLNSAEGKPLSSFRVVLKASLEVRSAVVFASLIVMLVFIPVFFLDGIAGSFFRPLAFSYLLAIAASLLVALTVTPALCLLLLPSAATRTAHDSGLTRLLKRGYRQLLPCMITRFRSAVGFLVVAFALTAWTLPQLGEAFLPNFKETDFLMHWIEKPGTSLEAMRRITVQASRELMAIDGVRNFGSHIGRAEVADEVVGPNFAELWISLDPDVDYDTAVAKIQKAVAAYPGLFSDVLTYLRERIKEVLTGTSATMVVRIYGTELPVLRAKAAEVGKAIADIKGITNLKVEPQILVPHIQVRLRPEVAANVGLTAGQVRRAITTLVKGVKVGEIYPEQKVIEVTVWGDETVRHDLQALQAIILDTPSGAKVSLGEVADVEITPTPNEIKREHASRRIDVTCNISSDDLGAVAQHIQQRVQALSFAAGYYPEFLGEYATRQAAQQRLFNLMLLSLLAVLLVLYIDFRSLRLVALVAFTLPFALIGGVFAVFVTDGVLSLGSLIGFVTVLGIAARNGIMLLSHYRNLQQQEAQPFGVSLIMQGAEERLTPILMTASCAALALLPLIIKGNISGQEIEYPMAVVILGGLITSTLLNLFVMPTLYARFGHVKT